MKWNCVQQLLYFSLLKFTISSKRIKHVGVNLPKETKDLYSINSLKFLEYKSFVTLGRFTPTCFILFDEMVNFNREK